MKNFKIAKLISFAFIALTVVSCYDQDVADVIDPTDYPTATFITEFVGSEINEGDTITYSITLDKPCDFDIEFSVQITDSSSTVDEHDYVITSGEIPAFTTGPVEVSIIILEDIAHVELDEAITFEVGSFAAKEKYTLSPETENPLMDLIVKTKNNADVFKVFLEWDNGVDDYDAYLIDPSNVSVSYEGATGDNPEQLSLANSEPDGEYFIEIDPWIIESGLTTFTGTFANPDDTYSTLVATVDTVKLRNDEYPMGAVGYQIMKITKTGSNYIVSTLSEYE